jgi:methionyl-tRNA formyltransferase
VSAGQTQMPSFIYAGQGGPLSLGPLEVLLEAGYRPSAVLIPESSQWQNKQKFLPVSPPREPDSLASMAYEEGLPLLGWQRGKEAEIAAKMAGLGVELVVCSCFPWRISAALLSVPRHGWWNLHPSLLPAYRGPDPLYWQQQAKETATGITLHQMDEGLDTGPILGAATVSLPLAHLREAEQILAVEGGQLVVKALEQLMAGQLILQPQDEAGASYQPLPNREGQTRWR